MRCLGIAVVVILVILLIAAFIIFVLPQIAPGKVSADLSAVTSDVERLDGRTTSAAPVAAGAHVKMYEGDGVNVSSSGYARLDLGGCLLQIFRNSGLQVQGLPGESAAVCIVDFEQGTIYNRVSKKTIVNTEWAVITTLSTAFFVHLDRARGVLWVIVKEGSVEIVAQGQRIVVQAGQQAWVFRGQPPQPPQPATRQIAGERFPPIDDLTNGVIAESALLAAAPAQQRIVLTVTANSDEVVSGACAGAQTLQITARVQPPAGVKQVTVAYGWRGVREQTAVMRQIETQTFVAEIGPFKYTGQPTALNYTVNVHGDAQKPLASESRTARLAACPPVIR